MDDTLKKILNIQPDNQFLEYIVERVQRDDYRGIQISQHNRYTIDEVFVILQAIYSVVGDDYLEIPPGDVTKSEAHDTVQKKYKQYSNVVETIHKK